MTHIDDFSPEIEDKKMETQILADKVDCIDTFKEHSFPI